MGRQGETATRLSLRVTEGSAAILCCERSVAIILGAKHWDCHVVSLLAMTAFVRCKTQDG